MYYAKNLHLNKKKSFKFLDIFSASPFWTQNFFSSEFVTGLQERLKHTVLNSRAESTTLGYHKSFQKWQNFAINILDVPTLPADPFHIALYLQHLAESSSIAAVNSTFYAINWAHGLSGIASPTQSKFFIRVKEGIVRSLSRGHPSRKEPLDIQHLKSLGAKIDHTDLLHLHSYVMFMVSFARFLRSSKVINLRHNGISFNDNYMLVSIRKSKTDQPRNGGTVVLAELKDAGVCPVKLMRRYLELARVPPVLMTFYLDLFQAKGKASV